MSTKLNFDAFLLDIEGTTTSISFVKEVLFPYCEAEAFDYFTANRYVPSVRALIDDLIRESNEQNKNDPDIKAISDANDFKTLTENVRTWIRKDLKLTSLKELQGRMWNDGYRKGHFKGHVYNDTPLFFHRCELAKKKLYIYSSGSVLAQTLLFKYTTHGSLFNFLYDFFDTHFGSKLCSSSYSKIALHLQMEPSQILFVTDVEGEAKAATEAGFQVAIMIREGNAPISDQAKSMFPLLYSFDDLIV